MRDLILNPYKKDLDISGSFFVWIKPYDVLTDCPITATMTAREMAE
jgi:hypothetical protein